MFSYSLEGIANENGEEIDNPPLDTLKPQGIIDDKKGAKKAADKKPGKEV
jgi:golgin subfamily B member 1